MRAEDFTPQELEILKMIRKSRAPQILKKRQRIKWDDIPRLLDVDNPLFPEIDTENGQEAKVGEIYSEVKRGTVRARILKEEQGEEKEEIVVVKAALWIWAVIDVPKLSILPNGKYFTTCWVPKVWNESLKKWIPADTKDCENWEFIPKGKRRIDFLIGVVPDD